MPESVKFKPFKTPKDRFFENPANITNHHALTDSVAFNLAVDTALLEYAARNAWEVASKPSTEQQTAAVAAGYKNVGAQEFVNILKRLSEIPKPIPQAKILDNLPDETQARRQ